MKRREEKEEKRKREKRKRREEKRGKRKKRREEKEEEEEKRREEKEKEKRREEKRRERRREEKRREEKQTWKAEVAIRCVKKGKKDTVSIKEPCGTTEKYLSVSSLIITLSKAQIKRSIRQITLLKLLLNHQNYFSIPLPHSLTEREGWFYMSDS